MRTGEVARLVGLGYSVLHTDIDVIWLRDPSPYLMCTAEAERAEFSSASRWPCAPMRQADVAVASDTMLTLTLTLSKAKAKSLCLTPT